MTDAANVIQSFREGCESYIAQPIVAADLLAKMDDLGLLASHAEVAYEGMAVYFATALSENVPFSVQTA